MAIKTFYKATNGTIFEDYDSAMEYDESLLKGLEGFFALDYQSKEIKFDDLETSLNDVFYVELLNETAHRVFEKLSDEKDLVSPSDVGIWLFDGSYWNNLEEEFTNLRERWSIASDRLELRYKLIKN